MLFPKHNSLFAETKDAIIGRLRDIYINIDPMLFYLYPFYHTINYKEGLLLSDGMLLVLESWPGIEPFKQTVVIGSHSDSYKFMTTNKTVENEIELRSFAMCKGNDFKDNLPTQHEFECFCLQNNIDISKVKLYDELEVNNQLLMFAKSVGIPEDILESWRL